MYYHSIFCVTNPDLFHLGFPDSFHEMEPGGKKSVKIIENYHKNHKNIILKKIIHFCSTDINIYPIKNKTNDVLDKYIFLQKKKSCYFLDSELDPEPFQLFHETVHGSGRIRMKMKRIRNTSFYVHIVQYNMCTFSLFND